MNLYNFPKIDLHLHLDGAFRFETIWELAQQQGVKMPKDTLQEYKEYIKYCSGCGSVNQYLRMFDDPQLVMQDFDSLSRLTYELIEDLHSQGVAYAEIRFAPQFHTQKDMDQYKATEAVLDGRKRALEKYPDIHIGILCCMMCLGAVDINEKENWITVEVCNKYRNDGVVGIDLAGAEGIVPLHDFAPFFAKAREYKLNITCHAGDSQGRETTQAAIDFGATRIGHGHRIFDDPDLCQIAIEKHITLENCPTSNVQCLTVESYEKHPAKKLYDMGVPVTINTDNPTLAGVTLDDEYTHCLNEMGFSYNDLIKMNINSAKAAFMDEETRKEIIAKLEAALETEK